MSKKWWEILGIKMDASWQEVIEAWVNKSQKRTQQLCKNDKLLSCLRNAFSDAKLAHKLKKSLTDFKTHS